MSLPRCPYYGKDYFESLVYCLEKNVPRPRGSSSSVDVGQRCTGQEQIHHVLHEEPQARFPFLRVEREGEGGGAGWSASGFTTWDDSAVDRP